MFQDLARPRACGKIFHLRTNKIDQHDHCPQHETAHQGFSRIHPEPVGQDEDAG